MLQPWQLKVQFVSFALLGLAASLYCLDCLFLRGVGVGWRTAGTAGLVQVARFGLGYGNAGEVACTGSVRFLWHLHIGIPRDTCHAAQCISQLSRLSHGSGICEQTIAVSKVVTCWQAIYQRPDQGCRGRLGQAALRSAEFVGSPRCLSMSTIGVAVDGRQNRYLEACDCIPGQCLTKGEGEVPMGRVGGVV